MQELLHVANGRLEINPAKELPGVGKEMGCISAMLVKPKKRQPWLRKLSEKGLPAWIPQGAQKAIYKKIRAMSAGNAPLVQWKEPIKVHAKMKLTLRDSQSDGNDAVNMQSVIFRAVPNFQGVSAQDCIKVLVESEGEEACIYFAQCMAFLEDAEDDFYVVVRWFETIEKQYGFDNINYVPSFKLEPENRPDSYCVLPACAILNGAVLIPGKDNRYWALLSPQEEQTYALQYHAQ